MKNIDDIILNLKQLYDDITEFKKSSVPKDIALDGKKIKNMAEKIPIKDHILSKADEYTQKVYLRLLCSILQFDNDNKTKESQMLFILRILAGINNKNIVFEDILASLMCMEFDEIDEIINTISNEFAEMFIVDSLICANITGKTTNNIFEYLSSIFSLFNIQKEIVKELVYLSSAILELDDERILLTKPLVNINKFTIYMKKPIIGHIVYNLEELITINDKDAIILNSKLTNLSEEINLDKFHVETISFINCTFENIYSIFSDTKQVKFINCEFNNNIIPSENTNTNSFNWFNSNTKSIPNFSFISLKYGEIMKCEFNECIVSKNLVNIENGSICNSVFNNCKSELCPSHIGMITLSNGKIVDCEFSKCSIRTDKTRRSNTTMTSIIRVAKGNMSNCIFKECSCYTQSDYGRYANHKPLLVYLVNSNINNCNFINCESKSAYDYDGSYYCCIIGLNNSIENNNSFTDCIADKNIMEIKD
jgi:hypothetical protein